MGWKRICQLKELCLIKLVDNNLASIFNVALIFAKTLMFLLFHYFISTQKKPNSFFSLICLKSVRKHRRSLRKLLDAILCKSFRSPQSIVWELFEISDFVQVAWQVFAKKKTNSQKQLNFSLSRVDIKFWLSTNNSFKDLPLFFFFVDQCLRYEAMLKKVFF